MNMHFISGLPRSGSTLLSAILQQNRAMRTSIISPVCTMTNALMRAMAGNQETSVFIDEIDRMRILRGLFSAYYAENDEQTILDSNRAWTGKLPLLVQLFPQCRMICCVRQPGWIMDSIEKLLCKNPTALNGIFQFEAGLTVFDRADELAASAGLIGFPLNALKEAFYGPFADRMMLVEYEALTKRPEAVISQVYDWLSLPVYKHDFEAVQQIPGAAEFDAKLGAPGLHEVGNKVNPVARASSLPPELFARFAAPFWRQGAMTRAKVILGN